MAVLVVAEHNSARLGPATLSAVTAAAAIDAAIDVLVAGDGAAPVCAAAAAVKGVRKVLHAEAAHYAHALAENVAPLAAGLAPGYTHVLAAATTTGKNLMPRIAALLDTAQISDIIAVESADTFRRPMYAGNIIATVQSIDPIKVITVRTTAFAPAAARGGSAAIESIEAQPDARLSRWVGEESRKTSRPELAVAEVVVAGGRGVGSAENFRLIEALADQLGAAVGASRAAVDAGFVPNDCQIGQTGKVIAPKLYFAIGISGAIQHLTGMKDSKVIVAINKDEHAPIFQLADYGIVGDLSTVVPELIRALECSS